jgi:hypothetical protein
VGKSVLRVLPAVVVATLAAGAVGAQGHKFVADSEVVVAELGPNGTSGKVTSPRKFCRADRTIELWGQLEPGVSDKLASTKTDNTGRWRFSRQLQDTKYKFKLPRKLVKRNGHKHKCPGVKTGKYTF